MWSNSSTKLSRNQHKKVLKEKGKGLIVHAEGQQGNPQWVRAAELGVQTARAPTAL